MKFRALVSIRVIAAAAALSAAACGQRLTDRNLDAVQPEMTTKEVESILGQPARTKSHELTLMTQMKTLPATRYYYEQNGQLVELIFVNDKLVGKVGQFSTPAPAAAPAATP